MRPYDQLTSIGRLRRLRQLAQSALADFGIEGRFKFLRWAGNTLFRVYASGTHPTAAAQDLFAPGQYLLRLHGLCEQPREAVELELTWLAAMRREADLPVPEPVCAPDGRMLVIVSAPGVPEARACSLLRWINGRPVRRFAQPEHFHAQGRLMARMHNFAANWSPPVGLVKRRLDWDGLFANDVGSGMPNAEAWALLLPDWEQAFGSVAQRVGQVMETWGEGPEVFGLIHADLAEDANLLFWHGEPRAIDFDDSAYGYWLFDLAVGLEHIWGHPDFPACRAALLAGYSELRRLPVEQLAQLELFIAAVQVYWTLWAVGGTHLHPDLLPEYRQRIERNAQLVMRFVQRTNDP